MTPVRLEPAAPRSRVKHFTTLPLRSQYVNKIGLYWPTYICVEDGISKLGY